MGAGSKRDRYLIKRLSSSAKSFLKQHLDPETKKRIEEAFDIIESSPYHYQKRISALHGELKGKIRYRYGNVRIIYVVDRKNKTINISDIEKRGDIY